MHAVSTNQITNILHFKGVMKFSHIMQWSLYFCQILQQEGCQGKKKNQKKSISLEQQEFLRWNKKHFSYF